MRTHLRTGVVVVALLVMAGCLGYLSTLRVRTTDWSAGQRASLSDATRAVLARLDGPVSITSYARPDGAQRAQIAAFIARYRRFKPELTLTFVDPERDPAATREAGITVNGELVVHYHGRRRYLRRIDERHLTNALESLARGGHRIVAFVTGDGERAAAGDKPADLGDFVAQLEKRGIRAVPLNLTQVPQVPEGTRAVVLASPLTRLPDTAVKALAGYVEAGGNLLWLADPDHEHLGLAPLADMLGVAKLPGALRRGRDAGQGDPHRLRIADYPPHPIVDGFSLSTIFPRVAALAQTRMGEWKVVPVLRAAAHLRPSRKARQAGAASAADPRADASNFGLALTRLSPGPGHRQQRVLVIGGGDFLSNAFVDEAGNRALGERMFNWLLGDDALIGVPSRRAASAPLALSQDGLNRFTFVFLVAVPGLLVLIGLVLGWRRRRR